MASGVPTTLESPKSTASFPRKSILLRFNSSMQPKAVQGIKLRARFRMTSRLQCEHAGQDSLQATGRSALECIAGYQLALPVNEGDTVWYRCLVPVKQ